MTDADAKMAVQDCHNAFLEWRKLPSKKRAGHIDNIGKKLKEYCQELMEPMTEEMGKTLEQGGQEVDLSESLNFGTDNQKKTNLQSCSSKSLKNHKTLPLPHEYIGSNLYFTIPDRG